MTQKDQRSQFYKNKFYELFEDNETVEHLKNVVSGYSIEEELYFYAMIPVLIEFVKWVLNDAVASGKKRLYFLARDGFQMYVVAKELVRKLELNLDCRYLSVSRYSMRIPEYHLLKEKSLDYICTGGIDVTFEKVCKRAGLNQKEVENVAIECGWLKEIHRVLNYQEVIKLKEVLKNSKSFMEKMYAYSEDAYPAAIGYLEQEGMLEQISYALVDSGWVGTLQQTIQHLLQSKNPRIEIDGYYFGMYDYPKQVDRKKYHTYYFSPREEIRRKVFFSNCLFESVFSAPEGMALSYLKNEKVYIPQFDLHENPNSKMIRKNEQILKDFLKVYQIKKLPDAEEILKGKKRVEKILKEFMGFPTELEVNVFGNILFSDDVLEEKLQKVSAQLSQEEIKKQRFFSKLMIMAGIKKESIHESAWIEGSIVKNKFKIKENIRHAHLYKYFIYIRKALRQGG